MSSFSLHRANPLWCSGLGRKVFNCDRLASKSGVFVSLRRPPVDWSVLIEWAKTTALSGSKAALYCSHSAQRNEKLPHLIRITADRRCVGLQWIISNHSDQNHGVCFCSIRRDLFSQRWFTHFNVIYSWSSFIQNILKSARRSWGQPDFFFFFHICSIFLKNKQTCRPCLSNVRYMYWKFSISEDLAEFHRWEANRKQILNQSQVKAANVVLPYDGNLNDKHTLNITGHYYWRWVHLLFLLTP